ncbi:MAG TPA: MATE family efflux transporter, partial [Treponemataceae bacterium]|nr:MATE family efflux transporter [Treponemataceae bacterium]
MAHQLGKKDAARRLFILEGDMWNVLFTIGLPLVFYNGISQFFQFFDTIIASNMSANVVSTVSFISQIQSMLAAIGSGLGISGGIIIARFYGAGNMEEVNKNISTIVFLALGIGLALLAVILPFSVQFLRFFGMPEDLITAENIVYFMFEIAGLVSVFINTIYFAIERAKGKTKTIFWFNMLVLAIKFCLTLFFVYVLKKGIIMLSLSSFIAQSLLTIIAIRSL